VERKRILTGVRPTGPLHVGHYAGALENWLKLQHEYDCTFLVADDRRSSSTIYGT
jgi:tryptophanyl-tRNA synthetase